MSSLEKAGCGVRPTGLVRRPVTGLLIAGSLLVPSAVCLGAVIDKVNVTRTGETNTATFTGGSGAIASTSSTDGATAGVTCDWIVVAVVGPLNTCIDILSVTQNAQPLDEGDDYINRASTGADLLTDAMSGKVRDDGSAIYNAGTEDLDFFTFRPIKCAGIWEVTVTYQVISDWCEGPPVIVDSLVAGSATESDLIKVNQNPEQALSTFGWIETPIVVIGIPTASAWGLLVLALLLLVGAKAYFGSRKGIQKVE